MPSISAAKPAVAVTIDRPRRLRYTWDSANRFEERYGKSLPIALMEPMGSARLITHIVWAGLLHEEPKLQVRDVELRLQAFINNGGDIMTLSTESMRALMSSGICGQPIKEEEEKKEDSPADPQPAPEGLE